MLTAFAKYAKAQEIEPIELAIPGPIIGKASNYGKWGERHGCKCHEAALEWAGFVSPRPAIVRHR
jgi:hypothetical protein